MAFGLLNRLVSRRRALTPTPPVDRRERLTMANGLVLLHHPVGVCSGEHCVLHNPSDHTMVNWPLNWRADRGLFERICAHGVGHPDPDSVAHLERLASDDGFGVHGCDGCCAGNAAP